MDDNNKGDSDSSEGLADATYKYVVDFKNVCKLISETYILLDFGHGDSNADFCSWIVETLRAMAALN